MNNFELHLGDCLETLKTLPDDSVDSIVTDPPYGLSFMGKKWDYDVPSVEIWTECLRVLKPGGHLLAFAGTRTQHRMAVRIEDAGFEIRDMIAWVYGTGFPKSLDVSKTIDKAAGAEREVVGVRSDFAAKAGFSKRPNTANAGGYVNPQIAGQITAPSTEAAKQWQGWGTALKPALEPITVARKPLIGTVAENVLEHGTGAINIDGCRVAHVTVGDGSLALNPHLRTHINGGNGGHVIAHETERRVVTPHETGRWPANLIHDGSDEVLDIFPDSDGSGQARTLKRGQRDDEGWGMSDEPGSLRDAGTGSAARFFYCAKASKKDRDEGLEDFEDKATAFGNQAQAELKRGNLNHDDGNSGMNKVKMRKNTHPTVKPTDLMRYLCRLVTPPGGVILDPFMGSGSTGKAALLEGFRFIGCELSPEYMNIAKSRIESVDLEEETEDSTEVNGNPDNGKPDSLFIFEK
jgi:DNA modification methylase